MSWLKKKNKYCKSSACSNRRRQPELGRPRPHFQLPSECGPAVLKLNRHKATGSRQTRLQPPRCCPDLHRCAAAARPCRGPDACPATGGCSRVRESPGWSRRRPAGIELHLFHSRSQHVSCDTMSACLQSRSVKGELRENVTHTHAHTHARVALDRVFPGRRRWGFMQTGYRKWACRYKTPTK